MRATRLLPTLLLSGILALVPALAGCGPASVTNSGPAPAAATAAGSSAPSTARTAAAPPGAPASPAPGHSLFMYNTIQSLVIGQYDGNMTIGQLKSEGDYGIGTINGLNGEVVEMGDTFYQIASTGRVHVLPDTTRTPWMIVTHFAPQRTVTAGSLPNLTALSAFLAKFQPNHNVFYAVRLTGTFSAVKARSVPKQHRPFPPLTTATAHQVIFRFNNVQGTVFGFWTPSYLAGLNVPGYHLHFLNQSRTAGGHILALAVAHAKVEIERIDSFRVDLPNSAAFSAANLTVQTQALQQAETNHPSS